MQRQRRKRVGGQRIGLEQHRVRRRGFDRVIPTEIRADVGRILLLVRRRFSRAATEREEHESEETTHPSNLLVARENKHDPEDRVTTT
jgi:hypothetical protein